MNDLLRVADLSPSELAKLLEVAARVKANPDGYRDAARGKIVAILFDKPSLRTRFSVEAALARIGASAIGAYDPSHGFGVREPVGDAGRVLDGYVDAICMRTFRQSLLAEVADVCEAPVVNALSDDHHPLQGLADLMTITETADRFDDHLKVAYVGDGNNVCHSLIEACVLAHIDIAVACPASYEPKPEVVEWATAHGNVDLTDDPYEAVKGATAVYTDVWASMGQEQEAEARARLFEPYRVTPELMAQAAEGALFLHCLPAHRGDEVDADVIDGPASVVFDQAHNRLYTAAAVFLNLLETG